MIPFLLQVAAEGERWRWAVGRLADQLLDYFLALAAIGAVAMALVEAAKKLFSLRARFHAQRVTDLFRTLEGEGASPDAYGQLLQLCTGVPAARAHDEARRLWNERTLPVWAHTRRPTPEDALFALDTDRMVAAMREAADMAIAAPGKFEALFRAMCRGADDADVDRWLHSRSVHEAPASGGVPPAPGRDEARELANVAARLRQAARQRLAGFQLYAELRWTSGNQFWSNVLGATLMCLVLAAHGEPGQDLALFEFIILSLLGGLLAPVAKDLVTALSQARSPARRHEP